MTHILHNSEWQDLIYLHFNDNRFFEQMSTDSYQQTVICRGKAPMDHTMLEVLYYSVVRCSAKCN